MNFIKLQVRTLAHRYGLPEQHVIEHWSERAAVREHDGGMTRDDAERAALGDVRVHLAATREPVSVDVGDG